MYCYFKLNLCFLLFTDMNYYYTMQDKPSVYPAGSLPGSSLPPSMQGSLACSSMQGQLSSLGYGAPQQSSMNPGAGQLSGNQSSMAQHPSAGSYGSAMQGPGNPNYPSVSYAQSPYAPAMYQSPLAYSQATMAAQNSAAAYMAAAAAGAQSASPYGGVRLPTTSTGFPSAQSAALYGYHNTLNGQPIYASHPGGMQPGMHPAHMAQGMSPSMPPGYPSSISSLSGAQARPHMSTYPGPSPFARLP